MTTEKDKKILSLLNQLIEESQKIDIRNRIEKAQKGELDEKGDSFMTFHLKMLKNLFLYSHDS